MTHAFIGLMVLYRLTAADASQINKRREDFRQNAVSTPVFAHVGNVVSEAERVPMIITQVWPNEFGPGHSGINGQAFLDGNDSLWVTSVEEGDQPGQWEAIMDG